MSKKQLRITDKESAQAICAMIRSELIGQSLSLPGRSLPSILLLKFGELRWVDSRHQHGYCDFLIEAADWVIWAEDRLTASNESCVADIDAALLQLKGAIVRQVIVHEDLRSIIIEFGSGSRIQANICPDEALDSQWTFYRGEKWNVSLEADKTLVVEA
ncbi:MAG: hypothetical protein AB7S74_18160 [Hyphomicrobium sp.]